MGKIKIVEGIRIHFGSNFVKQTETMYLESMLMVKIISLLIMSLM